MYALYDKTPIETGYRYQFHETASLFGCRAGYIPWLLQKQFSGNTSEPLNWHINVRESLEQAGQPGQTLVINLKPNNVEPTLSLYEVLDVWGRSADGWTPVMMRLDELFGDEEPQSVDERNFVREDAQDRVPIFSMTYLLGTVTDGKLEGRWTPPGPSSTNSVLLWPEALTYFSEEARPFLEAAQKSH